MILRQGRTLLPMVLAASPAAAQCVPQWSAEFAGGGLGREARCAAVFDEDGPGPREPALFVGGGFRTAGEQIARGIARWDGAGWSPVGSDFAGACTDLLVFDVDGPGPNPPALYAAGGRFTLPGGSIVNGVVRWDGSAWSAMTPGWSINASVNALATFDPDGPGPGLPKLAAGGSTLPGNARAALWDGVAWSALPGLSLPAESIASCDHDGAGPQNPVLYAGTTNSGASRWTGTTWQSLPGLSNGSVYAMIPYDADGPGPQHEALLVGGSFSTFGTPNLRSAALWDGSAWAPMHAGLGWSDFVYSLAIIDPDQAGPLAPVLWAGGWLAPFGGRGVAEWDGTSWLPAGSLTDIVRHISGWEQPGGTSIVAVGDLIRASGSPVTNIAIRTAGAWSPPGPLPQGANHTVDAILAHDPDGAGPEPEEIYVGGYFSAIGGTAANGIARRTANGWEPLGQGLLGTVMDLRFFDEDGPGPVPERLYATGTIHASGAVSMGRVVRWDGSAWAGLPTIGDCFALDVFDEDGAGPLLPSLFAAGAFGPANGYAQRGIVRWQGGAWVEVGGGISGGGLPLIRDCLVHDPDGAGPEGPVLVIGGSFSMAGATAANNIAAWDGSAWRTFGPGLSDEVRALVAFDADGPGPDFPRLIASGVFPERLARWDGSAWQSLGFGGIVQAMHCTPPSHPHPALYIMGNIEQIGGVPAAGVALWNGQQWSALGSGLEQVPLGDLSGAVLVCETDDPAGQQVYLGGRFELAGGLPSLNLARWGCEPAVCYPNCDNSTAQPTLNVGDFTCFLQRFAAGDPYANCDQSTIPPTLNVADFTCFLQRFAQGCP